MPTEEENVQYLYLVLTHGGAPTIDWEAVGEAMDLKKGAVSKRWSRLKASMEKGETPSGSAYKFLWICVKHSSRDKVHDWNAIAEKCGTTAGAASKRYSRMKQAFEAGDAAPENNPAAPAPKTPSKATPKKSKATTTDGEATPTPKRKRATPKKKGTDEDEVKVKPEPEIEDEDEEMESPTKKPKVAKPRATRKAKAKSKMEVKVDEDADMVTSEPSTPVENEDGDGGHDGFVDVKEWVSDLVGEDGDTEEESAERVNEWLAETV